MNGWMDGWTWDVCCGWWWHLCEVVVLAVVLVGMTVKEMVVGGWSRRVGCAMHRRPCKLPSPGV
eukprot:89300-Chlamydomonas_euryale.AAC.3